MKKQSKCRAFTLAEVLITLAIVGVVAAITMPALIQNHKRKSTAIKLKNFYSTMYQAIRMSEADNGPVTQWNKEDMGRNGNTKDPNFFTENSQLAINFFDRYIKNYINYTKFFGKIDENQLDGDVGAYIKIYLADGTTLYLNNGLCFAFLIDVNGDKKPNKHGRDMYSFLLCSDQGLSEELWGNRNIYFGPRSGGKFQNRQVILSTCKEIPYLCSTLLMHDDWEFKKDYPYKL